MRQVWIPRTGTPDVLEVRTAPDPQPGQGEIRIRVKATGINFADVLARMGLYPDAPKLPCVVGYEVAGDVDAVGPGVTEFQVGDRVVSLTRFGGYSDVVVVPATLAAVLPAALTYETAAALPVNWLTAWLMLVKLGNVQKGDRVLVHAAAGGVGQAAIQIAHWRGATVIGTASASKHARLRESGVECCIDYTTENVEQAVKAFTGGKGVDIVLDAVGGDSFKQSYASLAPMGRLFMFGVSSFAPGKSRNLIAAARGLFAMPKFAPIPLMNENRGVFGVNLGHLWEQADTLKAMLAEIVALTADGTFSPVIDRKFPFEQAAEAHRFLQDRKNFGKVLLVP